MTTEIRLVAMKPSTTPVAVDNSALSTLLLSALLVSGLLLASLASAAQQVEASLANSKGGTLCASLAKDSGQATINTGGRGEASTAPAAEWLAAAGARSARSAANRAASAEAAAAHLALVAAPSALELSIASYGKTPALTATGLSSSRSGRASVESSSSKKSAAADPLQTAAGHHHHHGDHHGKYYMYAEVPKKHAYKMGFRRGNHKHMIERKESVHKSHVHSYFKWHDKKGKGSHKFEFKHHDKKGHY